MFLLTTAVLDIYSYSPFVLHKYSFLRIKIPSVFHEKVRFLNILFIPSILPCIKKIRLIRARIIFLKHQDSFRVKFVFEKIKLVFEKIN